MQMCAAVCDVRQLPIRWCGCIAVDGRVQRRRGVARPRFGDRVRTIVTKRRPNVRLSVDKQLVVVVVGRKPFADRMGGMEFPVWTRCDYASYCRRHSGHRRICLKIEWCEIGGHAHTHTHNDTFEGNADLGESACQNELFAMRSSSKCFAHRNEHSRSIAR